MPGPIRNTGAPRTTVARDSHTDDAADGTAPGAAQPTGGGDGAPEPVADAAPAGPVDVAIPDVPSRPQDRVTNYVESNTRILPSPDDPEYNRRVGGHGRSVFDVRVNPNGGTAGVTTDLARDDASGTRTGERRGSVDVNRSGVHLDAGSNTTVTEVDPGRTRRTVADANLDIAPDGNVTGRVAGNHERTRTTDTGSETRRGGGEVRVDRNSTTVSGTAGRTSIDGERRAEDDVRFDVTGNGTGHSVHVEGRHTRNDANSTLTVTEDLTARNNRDGTSTLDGGVSANHRRTDGDRTRELSGTVRGSSGTTDGSGRVEVRGGAVFTGPDGARDSIDAGGTLTADGGTGRVDVGHRRTTDAGSHDVNANANVTVSGDRLSGGGEIRGERVRRDDRGEVRDTGRVAATGTDTGFTVDASGGRASTHTVPADGATPGSTVNRELRGAGRADVNNGTTRLTGELTGHTETRRDDGSSTRLDGRASGNVTTSGDSTRVDGQLTGTRTVNDGAGNTTTTTVTGRGSGDNAGDASVHIEARHDVATVTTVGEGDTAHTVSTRTRLSTTVDARRDRGEATVDATRTVTANGTTTTLTGHGEGEVNPNGMSGRLRGEREVRGPDDARTHVLTEVHGRQGNDGTVTAGGRVTATHTTPDNSRTVSGTVDGEVRVDAGGVSPSGGVEGDVTNRDDEGERRIRGMARTDGTTPTVGLRVENTERGDGTSRRDNVEANGNLRELRGSLIYERERTIEGDGRRRLHVNVDAHPEGFEGRIDRPIDSTNAGSSRYGGSVSARHRDVSVGVDSRTPIEGGGATEAEVRVGVNHGRVGVNGTVARTRTGNTTRSVTVGLEHGDGRTDAVLSTALDWKTDYGRIGAALAGHIGRTDKVTDMGAIPELGGAHRVMFETGSHQAIAAGGGLTVGMVGGRVGGRTGRFKHAAYITHMDSTAAKAAGEAPAAQKMPDVADPLALKMNDVLMLFRSGDMGISADLAFAGVSVTGRKSVRGDFRFIVERLDGNKIRLTVSPETINSVGVGGRILIAEAGVDKETSEALTQTYEIDLSTPAGIAVYKKALEGELPVLKSIDRLASVGATVNSVSDANKELPSGVTALALERRAARSVTTRVGFSWAFFGRESTNRTTTADTIRAENGRVVSDRSTERERVRETWFSGVERRGVYASVSHVTEASPTPGEAAVSQFNGIRFGAHYEDERTKGDELEALAALMSEVFGFGWQTDGLRGYGERRRVEVALDLNPAALAALSRRQIDALEEAGDGLHIDRQRLRSLVKTLKDTTVAAERADALQAFVAERGMVGLGAIVRAFKHLKPTITADTQAYDDINSRMSAITTDFSAPPTTSGRDFAVRFERCMRSKREIDVYLKVLRNDPLLEDAVRSQLVAQFEQSLKDIETALDLTAMTQPERDTLHADIVSFAVVATDHAAARHVTAYSSAPIGAPG